MSQATHRVERQMMPSFVTTGDDLWLGPRGLARLSIRDLIAELTRVEDALRTGAALLAGYGALGVIPGRRELLRRADAIVGELAARRRAGELSRPR